MRSNFSHQVGFFIPQSACGLTNLSDMGMSSTNCTIHPRTYLRLNNIANEINPKVTQPFFFFYVVTFLLVATFFTLAKSPYFALSASWRSFGQTQASLDVRCLGLPLLSPGTAAVAAPPALTTIGGPPPTGLVAALRAPPLNSSPTAERPPLPMVAGGEPPLPPPPPPTTPLPPELFAPLALAALDESGAELRRTCN